MNSWTSIRYLILISGLLSAYAGLIAHDSTHRDRAVAPKPSAHETMAEPPVTHRTGQQKHSGEHRAALTHQPLDTLSDVQIRRMLDTILYAPEDYVGADLLYAQVHELTGHDRLGEYAQQVLQALNEAAALYEPAPQEAQIASPETVLASDDMQFKANETQDVPFSSRESLAEIRDALIYTQDAQTSIALIHSAAHLQSEASLALVLSQAQHSDKAVRRGVVRVLGETLEQGWAAPEAILDTLQHMQDDPSPTVAECAQRVLEDWTRS